MALLRFPDENRVVQEPDEIRGALATLGIVYQRWPVENRASATATAAEILAAFGPEVEALKQQGGYVTADVIDVTADIPGLQAMLDKFNKEHTHAEDEVRFIVRGHGVFHVHPPTGPVLSIEVQAGDLINVPAGTRHWFDLCEDRNIRAIRLFREQAGWTPHYSGSDIAAGYAPICFGPSYIPPQREALTVHPALA